MKWWIDIANAPHATLFYPIARRLEERGHDVVLTVWDRGQTRAIAGEFWPEARVVGVPGFRRPVLAKATSLWDRATALRSTLDGEPPDVALGHNSYSQLIAAKRMGLPSITMMDYEHQPANHLAFRLADLVVTPKAIPPAALRRFGLRASALLQYPGYKEEFALADFRPHPDFRRHLGIEPGEVLAVVRPAAEGALYHRHRNTLCDDVIERLVSAGARVLLTPRTKDQALQYGGRRGVTVLTAPVSGADLLYAADLVIGAGGTMTREAAVLGTPTWSIFEGRPAAVDRGLSDQGMLAYLRSADELPLEAVRRKQPRPWDPPAQALSALVCLLDERAQRLVDASGGPASGLSH
jgi:predicted glycosyltransferase